MKHLSVNTGAVSLSILLVAAFLLLLQHPPSPVNLAVCVALFFALLVPAAFMIARRRIRIARLQRAGVFRGHFNIGPSLDPQFEFLARKYGASAAGKQGEAMAPAFSSALRDWSIGAASLPFALLTAAGFFLLFLPASELPHVLGGSLGASILSVGGAGEASAKDFESAVTIACLAFAGAYLYSLRLLLKALIAFDLSSIVFLRAFAHMLLAIMVAVVLWRAAPDVSALHDAAKSGASAPPQSVSKAWLFLAFGIGFIPDAAFSWLWRKTRLAFNRGAARLGRRKADGALTLIEGVDFLTARRLEEIGIGNVQNLASSNPIMIHVETSICIFTVVDWVAQAQLCAAVGPQRFFLFRKINVRTIFDLERAVLDVSSPLGSRQMAGAILLASGGETNMLRDFGVRPLAVTYRDFETALTSWVNVEVIEHLVRVVVDGLHISRLRQIRRALEASIDAVKPDEPRRPLKIAASQPTAEAYVNGHDRATAAEVPVGLHSRG
jgi:hypothetical protein